MCWRLEFIGRIFFILNDSIEHKGEKINFQSMFIGPCSSTLCDYSGNISNMYFFKGMDSNRVQAN